VPQKVVPSDSPVSSLDAVARPAAATVRPLRLRRAVAFMSERADTLQRAVVPAKERRDKWHSHCRSPLPCSVTG
jgi:hypothetical protein